MTTKKQSGNPAKTGWEPLRIAEFTLDQAKQLFEALGPDTPPMTRELARSDGRKHHYGYRRKIRSVSGKAFDNRLYNGTVLIFEDGSMHISFKRNDRTAVRDWRHFQAIKNEVAGPEREAIEIFPPESQLVDAANEYHLWVLPEGEMHKLGLAMGAALLPAYDDLDNASYRQGGKPGGRQRPWEDGIPTGLGVTDNGSAVEDLVQEARERATCSRCLARTYRNEECVCENPGDAEDYDVVLNELGVTDDGRP